MIPSTVAGAVIIVVAVVVALKIVGSAQTTALSIINMAQENAAALTTAVFAPQPVVPLDGSDHDQRRVSPVDLQTILDIDPSPDIRFDPALDLWTDQYGNMQPDPNRPLWAGVAPGESLAPGLDRDDPRWDLG